MRALALPLVVAVMAGCGNDISVGISSCPEYWYQDVDQDGYGDPDSATQAEPSKECRMPSDAAKCAPRISNPTEPER